MRESASKKPSAARDTQSQDPKGHECGEYATTVRVTGFRFAQFLRQSPGFYPSPEKSPLRVHVERVHYPIENCTGGGFHANYGRGPRYRCSWVTWRSCALHALARYPMGEEGTHLAGKKSDYKTKSAGTTTTLE